MAAALLTVSRGTISWVVGALTAGEAILEAFASAMDGRWDKVVLWVLGAFVLLGLARLVETYKV